MLHVSKCFLWELISYFLHPHVPITKYFVGVLKCLITSPPCHHCCCCCALNRRQASSLCLSGGIQSFLSSSSSSSPSCCCCCYSSALVTFYRFFCLVSAWSTCQMPCLAPLSNPLCLCFFCNLLQLYWPASADRVQECLMAGKDPEVIQHTETQ